MSFALGGISGAFRQMEKSVDIAHVEWAARSSVDVEDPAKSSDGPDLAVNLVGLIVARTMLKSNIVTIQSAQATYQDILKLSRR